MSNCWNKTIIKPRLVNKLGSNICDSEARSVGTTYVKVNILITTANNFGAAMLRWSGIVKYKYLMPRKLATVLRLNLMRLHFPVDLTGNLIMIMIDKLVMISETYRCGRTWRRCRRTWRRPHLLPRGSVWHIFPRWSWSRNIVQSKGAPRRAPWGLKLVPSSPRRRIHWLQYTEYSPKNRVPLSICGRGSLLWSSAETCKTIIKLHNWRSMWSLPCLRHGADCSAAWTNLQRWKSAGTQNLSDRYLSWYFSVRVPLPHGILQKNYPFSHSVGSSTTIRHLRSYVVFVGNLIRLCEVGSEFRHQDLLRLIGEALLNCNCSFSEIVKINCSIPINNVITDSGSG